MVKDKIRTVATIILLSVLLLFAFSHYKTKSNYNVTEPIPEISRIKEAKTLKEKVLIYKAVIEKIGPQEAQEQLKSSGLPFDGESHLLNHTVGDYLYEKYKAEGLSYCKDYFLSSCYHGFVIRAVADRGIDYLSEVIRVCKDKGEHVVIQCAHAMGHGFLAHEGYKNLLKGIEDCDLLGQKDRDFPTFNCHDGVFMENVFAVHEDGKPSPDRWLRKDDPIYPCNDPRIPRQYIRACWSNQPSLMYQLFGGDLKRVADECLKVSDRDHQITCFDALARQIHPLTKGSVVETFRMCGLMPDPWVDPCIISISKAFFSVGDRLSSFEICGGIKKESKNLCYQELISIIQLYIKNFSERDQVCNKIKDREWIDSCLRIN